MNVRDRINRDEVEGARMFVAGNIVGFRAVFTSLESIKSATPAFQARINAQFELNGGPDLTWKTPAQVYEEMSRYVGTGLDFVKYGATGDGAQVNSEIGQGNVLRFTPEQQRAMVKAVHDAGKVIQTHQGSAESLHIAVEVGNDMAQHCAGTGHSRISDATIKLMLERKFHCGTQWGPLTEDEERQVREQRFPGSDQGNGTDINYRLENAMRMIKAGVPQLLSTDAGTIDPDVAKDPAGAWGGLGGFSSLIGEAEFMNLRAMRQHGMTPMMIIQSASKHVANAYKVSDMLGTLEAGKFADLLVLDADPLADIENMRKISMVVKEGETVDRSALPRNPILTSPEAVNPGPVRRK
jgi:imidazolonepropionase-like amidohydrolase